MFEVRSESRGNPFTDLAPIIGKAFLVGGICGASLLVTAQYAIKSLNAAQAAACVESAPVGDPPPSLGPAPPSRPNPPAHTPPR